MTGPSPDPEMAALKREFDTLREEFSALKERQQARNQELVQTLRAFGLSGEDIEAHVSVLMNHGLTRRAALLAVVGAVGGVGFLAGQETARADAVGQVGVEADPLTKLWAHELESGDGANFITLGDAIQQANEAVNSATTIGNVCYIEVDTSVSGFTVTIPASLEASGLELRFIDAGGSAGSNSYSVTSTNWNIDGSGSISVDSGDSVLVLHSAGDRWLSKIFTVSVDAGTVTADEAVIGELAAVFEGDGTQQTIGTGTETTLTNVSVRFEDTNIVDADPSTGKITVQKAGGYLISGNVHWRGSGTWSVGDNSLAAIQAAGNRESESTPQHSGDDRLEQRPIPQTMVNLTANDEIILEVFQDSGSDKNIDGVARRLNLTVVRLRQ